MLVGKRCARFVLALGLALSVSLLSVPTATAATVCASPLVEGYSSPTKIRVWVTTQAVTLVQARMARYINGQIKYYYGVWSTTGYSTTDEVSTGTFAGRAGRCNGAWHTF